MPTIRREATLRVVNDQVDIGKGQHLPTGDYHGVIETMVVMLHGHRKEQIGRVQLYLSEDQLDALFGPKPNSSRDGMLADFTSDFVKGNIREV